MDYVVENDHRADPASWRPLAPGVAMQILRMSTETGQFTVIIRADKGSLLPRHRHLSPAEIYILSGSGVQPQTGPFKPGDYFYENAGAVHDAFVFDEPVKLLMVNYGASAFLDDNDGVRFLLDVHQLQNELAS